MNMWKLKQKVTAQSYQWFSKGSRNRVGRAGIIVLLPVIGLKNYIINPLHLTGLLQHELTR